MNPISRTVANRKSQSYLFKGQDNAFYEESSLVSLAILSHWKFLELLTV